MNAFFFTGNVGKAGELKYTQSGKAILSFSVAVNSGFGDNKKTSWIKCLLWEKRAEALKQMIDKGVRVTISGEYCDEKWKDKEGVERSTPTVTVREIDVHSVGQRQPQPQKETFDHPSNTGEEVPF